MPQNEKNYGPSLGLRRRTLLLMAVCGIVSFALLLARLYRLQITDHERYEALAVAQQLSGARFMTAAGCRSRSARRWTTFISAPWRSRCMARTGN